MELTDEDRARIHAIGRHSGHVGADDYIYGDRCYEAGMIAMAARLSAPSAATPAPTYAGQTVTYAEDTQTVDTSIAERYYPIDLDKALRRSAKLVTAPAVSAAPDVAALIEKLPRTHFGALLKLPRERNNFGYVMGDVSTFALVLLYDEYRRLSAPAGEDLPHECVAAEERASQLHDRALAAELLAQQRGERIAWFEEKADALARYASAKPPKESAMLAVVTELLTDADRRALAAQDKDANG